MEFSRKYLTKMASKLMKVFSRVPQYMVQFQKKNPTCQRSCLYLRFLMTAATGLFKLYLTVTLLLNPWSVSPFRIGGAMPTVFSYFSEVLAREKRGEHLSWLCMFWMIGGIYASAMAWAIIPHYGKKSHRRKKSVLVI